LTTPRKSRPDSVTAKSMVPALPTAGPSCVVGIGASAGGFEATRSFFSVMPTDSGAAFVVVLHLDPKYRSLAAPLLQKYSAMPVQEAVDGALLAANQVYTAPSDQDLRVQDGRLQLVPLSRTRGLHLPVDQFFTSLAEACGRRAIGVVLSGTGSDGTLGAAAIVAQGGIVLVQEPSTAQFDGMPRSAMTTHTACKVVAIDKMPELICNYARHPYVLQDDAASLEADEQQAVQELLKVMRAHHDYDFSSYKRNTLLRRIQRRMGLRGIQRVASYVDLLKRDPLELDALFRDFQIGVTQFFRDPEAWTALDAEVLGALLASKPQGEPIRVWIPGCSTGQEAYSLAMLMLDRLRRTRKHCPVQIFATDTNDAALEIGRQGRYPAGIATQLSPARLRRYFSAEAKGQQYVVSEALRACVVFGRQNMFADPPFGRVDLISCRNVLIYLEPEIQKKVLSIFHFALRPGGYLFLGSAESNGGRDDLFAPLSRKWRIFTRAGLGRAELLTLPLKSQAERAALGSAAVHVAPALNQVAALVQKLVLEQFAPAAVLVNAQNQVLYFSGPTDDFLLPPRGAPTQDLLAMVREGLRASLRGALQQAAGSTQRVELAARMQRGSALVPVQLSVAPLGERELGKLFLVVFRPGQQVARAPAGKGRRRQVEPNLAQHLEQELQATRDDLQGVVARFEAANEELRLSNEQVVSSNEELRSLNEELESSKEELQSLNEELTTVNQQLHAKVLELEVSNSDLHNLMASSEIATLCLDRELRIKWFSPAAQQLFNLLPGDVGRPISNVISALGDTDLIAAARAVLADRASAIHQFQVDSGRWYLRRTLPYKDGDASISGVIVNYTDITDSQLAQQATTTLRTDLATSVKTSQQLRKLSSALALAEERERRILAKDLHDDLGQMLAVIAIKATVLLKLDMSAAMRLAVQECTSAVEIANQKVRNMALQLNPPMLDRLGIVPALGWLADEMHRVHSLDVQLDDDGRPKPLEPAISATLFRSVQQLLMNVCQHAQTNQAHVELLTVGATLQVCVSDAGVGFDSVHLPNPTTNASLSLVSMRERLEMLGGSASIHSVAGNGTRVTLTVPLLGAPNLSSEAAP
jgi:two-component system CheB/CheR fusion protein